MPDIVTLTQRDGEKHSSFRKERLPAHSKLVNTRISYGTEKTVGNAIKKSGIPRDQIFVTSKLWNNRHHPDDVALALQESLDDLGLDYLDLFLMHWPVAFKRGDDPFPKDRDGKLITENIDYIDV